MLALAAEGRTIFEQLRTRFAGAGARAGDMRYFKIEDAEVSLMIGGMIGDRPISFKITVVDLSAGPFKKPRCNLQGHEGRHDYRLDSQGHLHCLDYTNRGFGYEPAAMEAADKRLLHKILPRLPMAAEAPPRLGPLPAARQPLGEAPGHAHSLENMFRAAALPAAK